MARVKLKEQSDYTFDHTMIVRVTDLNYGAHLANNALVEMLHDARARLFHCLGCSEINLGDGHTGIILGDLVINFRAEGFLFDTLRIESHIGEISRKGFRIFQRVLRQEELVALAETGIVAFDYEKRQIAPIPQVFLRTLEQF